MGRMLLVLSLLICLVTSVHAQWRLFEVQGGVTAIVEDRSSRNHIIVTGGSFGCMISGFPSAECQFTNVYAQSDSTLRITLPLFDGDSGGLHGTYFRTVYAGDRGIVLVCDPYSGPGFLYRNTLLFTLPIGSDRFLRVLGDTVVAELVCRNSTVYGMSHGSHIGPRFYDLFSGGSKEASPTDETGFNRNIGGYMLIPPSDTVDYWRVSEDCGQTAVPYVISGIPGREIAMIERYLEPHQVAVMKNGDRYVTYDRARSWLKLPSPPGAYVSAGYEVKLEHLTNDSSMVLCLRKDSTEVLVYRTLVDGMWRELPSPPFPSLSFIGGGSVQKLYAARSPVSIKRPVFGMVTDSTQVTLALLDPTASIEEESVRPVPARRVVHRGEQLSFDEDAEWTLHGIDGGVVDRGRSASIPFDIVPGIYFLTRSKVHFLVAVVP